MIEKNRVIFYVYMLFILVQYSDLMYIRSEFYIH